MLQNDMPHRSTYLPVYMQYERSGYLVSYPLHISRPLPTSPRMASRRLYPSRVTNMAAPLIAIATVAIGATMLRTSIIGQARAEAPDDPPKMFSSGLNMVSLRLKASEDVNHNTKRLRFEFPNPDAVSGLPLTCRLRRMSPCLHPSQCLRLMTQRSYIADAVLAEGQLASSAKTVHAGERSR